MIRFIIFLILCVSQAAIADTYDGTTNRLTISAVQLGDIVYKDVVITVASVVSVSSNTTTVLTDAIALPDTYDAATNRLTIPFLQYGDKTFTNVVVTVGSVISVGSASPAPPAVGRYLLVFASNMQSLTGGCTRDAPSGCDLFMARFNYDTREISEVTRLTSHAEASEMFPSISPDSNWVAYDYALNSGHDAHDIRIINLQSKTTLLANARFPEWVDNTHLLVSRNDPGAKDVALLELDMSTSTPTILSIRTLCNRTNCPGTSQTSDAFPFPDGTRLAFQSLKSDREVAGLSTMNIDGTGFVMITGWDGSGHTIVNSSGTELLFSTASSGAAQTINLQSGARTALALPGTGAEMASYDSRYGSMVSVNWLYAAWLQTDRSVLFSAQGGDASHVYRTSRMILGDFDSNWANPTLFDISSAIENSAGLTGKDFCTVSARAIKSPLYGFMGTLRDDFSVARTLGANTVHMEMPETASAFSSMISAADTANVKAIVSIDKAKIQTNGLKFDLSRLSGLIAPLKQELAGPGVAALLLASDICHIDTATHQKKWDITAAELSQAVQAVKGLVPNLPVAVDFSKSTCLDSMVSGAAAGSSIGDIAILNFWYYKWSTTPGLLDSYAVSALNFKNFASSARVQVIPKIMLTETIGPEASAFPSTGWLVDSANGFLAYGSAFDGALYYDFRQQLPTEVKTISNVITDGAYVGTLRTILKGAQTAYTR